ncbi:Ser/Thr protein phosphatase family protein [Rasamsonia emersonii CBS 393.64]|uniref:Ser/Thr protein phosphatase family protein n=1 Tax=Rasamsonia emersonii (strain ATCC 16479 / CBS 393.64 / IMI 116815) TaxID=1408163 RepID=A0A0F4YV57_RASE3|nr:Ser/Thr protein phosphatase family protein [Rasamsonia emersonii CBS 393.64]KKA21995.1 Ser/Thr protein phosphatase family protein [Rasamsonia emersonii CBS 393.64]
MNLSRLQGLLALGSLSAPASAASSAPGATSYVAPAGFPTSAFSSYYFLPARPTQEPQPAIYDPVLKLTFPYNLTNPNTIPTKNTDPLFYPEPKRNLSEAEAKAVIQQVIANVTKIITANTTASNCTRCQDALAAAQPAAWLAPTLVPDAMVSLCKAFHFSSDTSCEQNYAASNFGDIWTQVLYYADVKGLDGQYICHSLSSSFCSAPTTSPLNTTGLFPKPKPKNPRVPKASGKRVKVLHMSDVLWTPGILSVRKPTVLLSASAYGSFKCDSPYDLVLAALQSVGPLTGTGKDKESLAWTIYTGDLVSHDPESELSRMYTEYTETSIYGMLKSYVTGPVFAALGNHDTSPANIEAPHTLPGPLGEQQSWNYDHVAGLWMHEGWIDKEAAKTARTHYGAYSIKNQYGLRIISFNTGRVRLMNAKQDFWYSSNYLNFINTTNPDNSGIFSFMIEELQKAEDAGDRVWIIGHVLSGWDGTNPLPNPTNLFYQIVDRYSPHVIANVFFGHTHEDQFMIYFANNGTVQNADTALTTGWIGPSVTPLTNLNSGFRLYEVDTGDFNIYEAYTFFSNVSSFPSLNATGPTFSLEYSTRDTYGPAASWGSDDPLNATFWYRVTEAMEKDLSLVTLHNTLQGKSSVKSPNCTNTACQEAKICYMRSGSVALGSQCPQGYGSVQSAFSPKS